MPEPVLLDDPASRRARRATHVMLATRATRRAISCASRRATRHATLSPRSSPPAPRAFVGGAHAGGGGDDAAAERAVDPSIAPLGSRAIAALIDLVFLAAIDATVLHFTLRLTGLTLAESGRLPLAPLFGFLAL